jgi:peptidoglycan/LPS O-acetylase OafA/YrhL
MRSSSGAYLSNLDHLRAFAAFQVFVWHFVHTSASCSGICFSRDYTVGSILEEGHTGVALFMCISGYIFAKLTDGHQVRLGQFWLNRILRLLPLLLVWSFITVASAAILGTISQDNLRWVLTPVGLARTILAPGGWSIVVELQFYALFPFLLMVAGRFGNKWLIAIVLTALAARLAHWLATDSVQYLAYWTLAGRIDQLLIGYCAYYFAVGVPRRRILILGVAASGILLASYGVFNQSGGFNGTANHPIWIFMPLLEAVCYSAIIAAYSLIRVPKLADTALGSIGTWSYSIYLGHFFLVPPLFFLFATFSAMPDSFYGRLMVALLAFPIVIGVGAMTYKTIEEPFLRSRRNYLK